MKSSWPFVFAALLLAFLNGCNEKTKQESWPYPVKDSGFAASGGNPVYWLDERRVLFIGHEGGKPRSVEESQALQWGIFIWDVVADTIEKYAVPAEGLCYHNGFIKYFTIDPDGTRVLMKGRMGKESRYPGTFYADMDRRKFVLNKYNCRLSERPESMQGRGWVPLLEEHGYLDLGPSRLKRGEKRPNYRFFPARGATPIELPFNGNCIWRIQYNPFTNSYLYACFFSDESDGIKKICNEVWDFTPAGGVTSQCVPYDDKIGTSGSRFPIQTGVGIAAVSHDLDRNGLAGKSGIYLYKDGEYQRLISGITKQHGLSPSGCRIAFYHMLTIKHGNIKWPGETTLMMIDLCSKEDDKQ